MLGMTIVANEKFGDDNFAFDSELLGMKNLLTQVICKLKANS
jgi:hypothetical protein